jgi:hypothetical protein
MTRDIVSIEKVLNSRCSGGFDFGTKKSHWGTFIDQRPPKKIINRILRCCNIPRFSNGKLLHCFKDEYLFLGFEKSNDPYMERVLHIESGMQQEAVYLACAAHGIGTCIHNQGINGTEYGEKIATARHLIMEMADPYESGKFTTKAPGPKKPFIAGKNLTEPLRDGDVECLPQLEHLTSSKKSGSSATEKGISQLLWAAKGRTPHLIRKHVWNLLCGLTIPTWGGGQSYTSIYLVKDEKLFRYVNWTKEFSLLNRLFLNYAKWTRGNPTHDIKFVGNINVSFELDNTNVGIILSRNEKTNRALWEVGYMLENMLLQAKSLGISYKSKVFTKEEIRKLERNGISEAVAALLL